MKKDKMLSQRISSIFVIVTSILFSAFKLGIEQGITKLESVIAAASLGNNGNNIASNPNSPHRSISSDSANSIIMQISKTPRLLT
jgi:hypothetical protein